MDQAHLNSRKGEEYEDFEDWENAFKAHKKSAECFLKLIEKNEDPVLVHALSGLWIAQNQKARDCKAKYDISKKNSNKDSCEKAEIHSSKTENQQSEDLESEFEKFWGYIDQWASNPIAFTTTNVQHDFKINMNSSKALESYYIVNPSLDRQDGIITKSRLMFDRQAFGDSTFDNLRDSVTNTRPRVGFKSENYTKSSAAFSEKPTKAELLDTKINRGETSKPMTSQHKELESALIENTILKSSIVNFKNDLKQHAKSFFETKFKEIATTQPSIEEKPGFRVKTSGEYNKIEELEQEVALLSKRNANLELQLKQQDDLLHKYKSRWEKLVESAKKRQAAKLEQSSK